MPKLLIIFLFLSLSGCNQKQTLEQVAGKTMSTSYTIKSSSQIDQQQVDQRLKQINQTFSSWDVNSELSQVNQQPVGQTVMLSDELAHVLNQSIHVYEQTNGLFDSGLGRLVDAWGFGATTVTERPSRAKISKLLVNTSISKTTLNNKVLTKQADIHLNLSAIAKGYAVDEIAKLLSNQEVERFMVEIGGEIKVKGRWIIGIEAPAGYPPIKIELIDESIATSGNYRQYFVWEGERYPHILNPKTGLPANSDLFSVSVIHPSNSLADAYATAMMSMGSERAQQLARRLKLKTVLILNQTDGQNDSESIIKLGL